MAHQHAAPAETPVQTLRHLRSRRIYVRYKCGLATPGRVQLDGQEWQRAWVLNLSLCGAGLLLSRPLEQGQEIVVHLMSGTPKKTHEIPARVCHATQQPDGEWIVGCAFVNQLSDDLLDTLL